MLSGTFGIIAFVVTLIVTVTFHEFGHYYAARRFGIKVEQFFIGFGPKIFSWTRGETEFGLKAVLLGGYVKIAGMNPWLPVAESDAARTFGAKPSWQRAIVLVAGSATHFILAFVLLVALLGPIGHQVLREGPPSVGELCPPPYPSNCPAKEAGVRAGDEILAIDGNRVRSVEEVAAAIREAARPEGKPDALRLTLASVDGVREVTVVPLQGSLPSPEGSSQRAGGIGIGFSSFETVHEPLYRAVPLAAQLTGQMIVGSVRGIGQIFSPSGLSEVFRSLGGSGRREADQPAGLVGAARLAGELSRAGQFQQLITIFAGFIVFVGVINLAPLPPLDGGHLLILLIEKVLRRKVDMRKVVPIATAVLVFFGILTFALLYLDIVRPIQNPFQ